MQKIAIISQKGGAGKSTLAIHLAVEAAKTRNVAIIDLDPQASAASWGDRREAELPVVISAHASRLPQQMEAVEQNGGELLIIDTAPHSDSAALAAARAADLVLVPVLPNIFDLEAAVNTASLLRSATETPFFVVLNGVAPVGTAEADEAAEALRGQQIPVCPERLSKRVAFARSLAFGQVAGEFEPDGKAATEIERLHRFVCDGVHTITPAQPQARTPEQDHTSATREDHVQQA